MKRPCRFTPVAAAMFCITLANAEEPKSPKIDVLAMKAIPEGKYGVKLELKQLDSVAAPVELVVKDGRITSAEETGRLGKVQGRTQFIGNGVFMVQLQGKDYLATQFWVFQADGSAAIKEIPDRGEKQMAVPVMELKSKASPAGVPDDAAARKKMPGDWIVPKESYTAVAKAGTFSFYSDGTFTTRSIFVIAQEQIEILADGTWEIEKGVLIEQIRKSSHEKLVPVGLITRDRLLNVSEKEYRFRTESGIEGFYVRKEKG